MSLTKKQRANMWITLLVAGILAAGGGGLFLIFNSGSYSSTSDNPPPVPQVSTSRYSVVNPGDGDPATDHFCVGSTGLWYDTLNGFQVLGNDPLCR